MNARVRMLVKREVRQRAYVVYAGLSRQGVSVVVLRVKYGGVEYEALGTAKRSPNDIMNPEEGQRQAYNRALVELVDRIADPNRRAMSIRFD